jgi:O-antigen ligase
LIVFAFPPAAGLQGIMESRTEQRIFWPAMAAISIVLVVRNWSRLRRNAFPPNITCLLAYLAFAGASTLWAFRPELSSIRYAQEMMVLASIVLPAILAPRTTDMMRGLFLVFAVAAIANFFFTFGNSTSIVTVLNGYPGYFLGKNSLGEFAAITFLLALHEVLYPGIRRELGIIIVIVATLLLFWSNSKTAYGLAILVPILAGLTLFAVRKLRVSPAIILLSIPLCYAAVSAITGIGMDRFSYMLFGDSSFSGRSTIWDFAASEIERRPLFGWGYQSFWLVGPDAPSVLDSPKNSFVKDMPNAHNGYYDTMLEMGYVGYLLLLIFVTATLHGVGRMAERDRRRAWLLLSLALYIIMHNCLETTWMRGFELMWVVFAIVAAEIGRHWQALPPKTVAYGPRMRHDGRYRPEAGRRSSSIRFHTVR